MGRWAISRVHVGCLLACIVVLSDVAAAQTAATTQPVGAESLFIEVIKSVELFQKSIRSARPVTPRASMRYKTALQQQTAATTPSKDVGKEVAEKLVGTAGSISFRVRDIY